jgi:hypothetical protein
MPTYPGSNGRPQGPMLESKQADGVRVTLFGSVPRARRCEDDA